MWLKCNLGAMPVICQLGRGRHLEAVSEVRRDVAILDNFRCPTDCGFSKPNFFHYGSSLHENTDRASVQRCAIPALSAATCS